MWRWLHPSDLVTAGYSIFLIALIAAFPARLEDPRGLMTMAIAIPAAVLILASWAAVTKTRWVRVLRAFDVVLWIPALFFMTIAMVHRINPVDYDETLLRADAGIGGPAVLRWMETITSPVLNDVMMILWVSYYALPVIPGIEMYVRRRPRFFEVKSMVLLGFFIAYVGYFAAPAMGAGYFLDRMGVADPGEGAGAMAPLKEAVHAAEGAEARDTYPSGHVAIAVVTLWYVLRHRLWLGWIAAPQALGVIFSTMYLRYHYIVDVIAGVLVGAVAIFLGWWMDRAARNGRGPGRDVVYESRRNSWRTMSLRAAIGAVVAGPAAYAVWVVWRMWRGEAWPEGFDVYAAAASPLLLGATMLCLGSGLSGLAVGRRFAVLDADGIEVFGRRVRWNRIESLDRVDDALVLTYRPGYVVPGEARAETLATSRGNASHFGAVARLSRSYLLKGAEPVGEKPQLTPPLV